MRIRVYIYICVCMWHVHGGLDAHSCVCVRVYACVHMCVRARVRVGARVRSRPRVFVCVCVCVRVFLARVCVFGSFPLSFFGSAPPTPVLIELAASFNMTHHSWPPNRPKGCSRASVYRFDRAMLVLSSCGMIRYAPRATKLGDCSHDGGTRTYSQTLSVLQRLSGNFRSPQ